MLASMTEGVGITRIERMKGQLLNTDATEATEATDKINGNCFCWLLGAESLAPRRQQMLLLLPFHPLDPRHPMRSCR